MNPSELNSAIPPVPLPKTWLASPPQSLVVGEGPYAQALGRIVGSAVIIPNQILGGPAPNEAGGYPLVLGTLARVFLVAGPSQTAADLLRVHDALWRWLDKLSPHGDQHELAILFILPPTGDGISKALAAGLGLERFEPDVPGHSLALMDESLEGLLAKAAAIVPQDLPPLRARRAADARHSALIALRQAVSDEALLTAAIRVNEVFRGQEYLLDLFCRPPSHRHGNLLRSWLNGLVTGQVTPQDEGSSGGNPSDWLDEARFS
jgi:hypothetical protein